MRPLNVLVCTSLILAALVVNAGDSCQEVRCPSCDHVCKLSVEKTQQKKHCWEVECQPICIPRVTFPWQKCCRTPKCAKLKYVRSLKKVEYECSVCKYEWTAEPVTCRGACGNGSSCDCDVTSTAAVPRENAGATALTATRSDPPTAPSPTAEETGRPDSIARRLFSLVSRPWATPNRNLPTASTESD
jgi:hypothetical protein